MLTVVYNPTIVTDWLTHQEKAGLDVLGSLDRFEGKVRLELMRWASVDGVLFTRDNRRNYVVIEPQEDVHPPMYAQIQLLFIDCHFLVYATPQEHVAALRDTKLINLRVSLCADIVEAYQIPRSVADIVVRAAYKPELANALQAI